jgi:hypothetical protein
MSIASTLSITVVDMKVFVFHVAGRDGECEAAHVVVAARAAADAARAVRDAGW